MLSNKSERSLSQISEKTEAVSFRFKAMYGTFQSSILQESAYLAVSTAAFALHLPWRAAPGESANYAKFS